MQDFDSKPVNKSQVTPFSTLVKESLSRRAALKTGVASTLVGIFGSIPNSARTSSDELVGFKPVSRAEAAGSWITVSSDYEFDIAFPWGDPIRPDGPAFQFPVVAADQAIQIGSGHDGMWLFQQEDLDRGVLCLNHEFGSNPTIIGQQIPMKLEQVRASQHAHGVSVLDVAKVDGHWQVVDGPHSRRIHANTPVTFGGPAKDSELLHSETSGQPRGTLNNCGSGPTPWQTYLTCEENFQGYFGASSQWQPNERQQRYGFSNFGFGYGWHLHDPRFNLESEENATEHNRFGWVVEIDPSDSDSLPVKRTALGRFKHEAACAKVGADNRVVVYMGDDQPFEYIYKFVGDANYENVLKKGLSPLDEGRLYVAKFSGDQTGEWLELTEENPELSKALGGQDAILTYARIAGELLGATPMDRPEWLTEGSDGAIYCALTNNGGRTEPNAANPQAPNPDGHIVRVMDHEDGVGDTFEWDVFKLSSSTHGSEESFSSPDGVYGDSDGRLFILTDGNQTDDMNNQLLVADTRTGSVKRLLSGVPGCEITGITHTKDRKEYFVNVQHPGKSETDELDFPRIQSDYKVPRDATVVLRRKDGGIVGS